MLALSRGALTAAGRRRTLTDTAGFQSRAVATRPAARRFHQSALDALAQADDSEPVIVVDLVKLKAKERAKMEVGEYSAWAAYSEARAGTAGRRLVSLTPHAGGSILMGQHPTHTYDMIELTEYPSAAAAHSSLTDPECTSRRQQAACQDSSVVIWAHRSAAFSGMPTFADTGLIFQRSSTNPLPISDYLAGISIGNGTKMRPYIVQLAAP